MNKLIGLVGYAQTGKDEAAKVLVEEHDFTRVAFADGVREALYALNPLIADEYECWRLSEEVDNRGWDEAKKHPEVRQLLQRMGTEAGRMIHGQDLWVNLAKKKARCLSRVVVTDVRFPNEAKAIQEGGGTLLRIERPGVGPVNNHISDRGVEKIFCDETLVNDGDLLSWRKKITNWLSQVAVGA